MLFNLQALRGLAALLVVFVHLDGPLKPLGDWSDALAFGNSGVDLFFVISGLVMVYTTARKPVTPGGFLLNRLIRVAPLYWGLTLLIFAAALVMPSLLQATRPVPEELAKSIAFVPFFKEKGQIAPIFFLGWTLNYEMAFYLLYAVSLWLARGSIRLTVALSVCVLAAALVAGPVLQPEGALGRFYTDPIIAEFGLGMLLGLICVRGRGLPSLLCWPLLIVGIAYLFVHPLFGEVPHGPTLHIAATLIVASVLGLERAGHALRNPMVQLLGSASYSLYLIHPFVTQAGAKLTAHLASPAAIFTVTALCWAATIPVAIAFHLRIERPLTDWLRHRVGYRRPIVDRAEDRAIAQVEAR